MELRRFTRLGYTGAWLFDHSAEQSWNWLYVSDCGLVVLRSEHFASIDACIEDARRHGYADQRVSRTRGTSCTNAI